MHGSKEVGITLFNLKKWEHEGIIFPDNFLLKGTTIVDVNSGKLQEMVRDREAWCASVHGVTKSWTQLGN